MTYLILKAALSGVLVMLMLDRNKGVKSSVAIAILLSKRQPRIIPGPNGPPSQRDSVGPFVFKGHLNFLTLSA